MTLRPADAPWSLSPLSQKVTNAPMSFVKARATVTLCSATPGGTVAAACAPWSLWVPGPGRRSSPRRGCWRGLPRQESARRQWQGLAGGTHGPRQGWVLENTLFHFSRAARTRPCSRTPGQAPAAQDARAASAKLQPAGPRHQGGRCLGCCLGHGAALGAVLDFVGNLTFLGRKGSPLHSPAP